jgi:hypothetical protein
MGKPTAEELQEALTEAIKMRESGDDPHHIAKALLNMNYRMGAMHKLLQAADQYLHFGQEEREHAVLLKAITAAKLAEDHDPTREEEEFGL